LRRLPTRSVGRAAAGALLPWLAACGGGDRAGSVPAAQAADAAEAARVDDFRPGYSPDDAAAASVDRFLSLSTAHASPAPGELEALLGCDMAAEHVLPSELLAGYEITGRSTRGDTVVVRARVVTVAEQDHSRREPGRFTATQRVREGEWEWDVVRQDGVWRPCAGPRFGLVAPDSLTTWRPDGASAATARALADSLRAAGLP
jgi:hypothetical protein